MVEAEQPREDGPPGEAAVLIPAFNAQDTIARAIGSALDQDGVAEVVVVDDCSSDATVDAARACDDGTGRLSVLALERNGGPSKARNAALAACRAPWLAPLDSDDYMRPGRIRALIDQAEAGGV